MGVIMSINRIHGRYLDRLGMDRGFNEWVAGTLYSYCIQYQYVCDTKKTLLSREGGKGG